MDLSAIVSTVQVCLEGSKELTEFAKGFETKHKSWSAPLRGEQSLAGSDAVVELDIVALDGFDSLRHG